MPIVQKKMQIVEGAIVKIIGTSFDRECGVVVHTASPDEPEDGPFAVYFDREVPGYMFGSTEQAERWDKGVPNKETYRECPRIVHFEIADLQVLPEWTPLTITKRLFEGMWNSLSDYRRPEASGCQIKDCGIREAPNTTYRNYWGTVEILNTCNPHHAEFHGKCAE